MKNIIEAPFMVETIRTLTNLYRLGWDERNGGNLSYLLYDEDIEGYLDTAKVIRTIPMSFDASAIKGRIFLVTGTGKYFKNVQYDPEKNLGILRMHTHQVHGWWNGDVTLDDGTKLEIKNLFAFCEYVENKW